MLGIKAISTVYRLGVGEFDASKSVQLFRECVMSVADTFTAPNLAPKTWRKTKGEMVHDLSVSRTLHLLQSRPALASASFSLSVGGAGKGLRRLLSATSCGLLSATSSLLPRLLSPGTSLDSPTTSLDRRY